MPNTENHEGGCYYERIHRKEEFLKNEEGKDLHKSPKSLRRKAERNFHNFRNA
jgi:hypothetical protein